MRSCACHIDLEEGRTTNYDLPLVSFSDQHVSLLPKFCRRIATKTDPPVKVLLALDYRGVRTRPRIDLPLVFSVGALSKDKYNNRSHSYCPHVGSDAEVRRVFQDS